MSSFQFTIPRRAADAVDFLELRRQGSAQGLARTSIECSTVSAPIGQTRITTSVPMAIILLERLSLLARAASERGKLELSIACAEGAVAALAAIDDERSRPADESPASHTKPAPN